MHLLLCLKNGKYLISSTKPGSSAGCSPTFTRWISLGKGLFLSSSYFTTDSNGKDADPDTAAELAGYVLETGDQVNNRASNS